MNYFVPNPSRPAERLRYDIFVPKRPRGSVLLLHGRSEFIEKYDEVIHELLERHLSVYTFDWRGQGMSCRSHPDPQRAVVDSFDTYVNDLEAFVLAKSLDKQEIPLTILAHSMGCHLAMRYLHKHPTACTNAVFCAPMLGINLAPLTRSSVELYVRAACRLGFGSAWAPTQHAHDHRDERFSHNRQTSDSRRFWQHWVKHAQQNPALVIGGTTNRWLKAALASISALSSPEVLRSISTPILMLSAMDDQVVLPVAHVHAATHLPNCELIQVHESKHEILMETDNVRQCFWRAFDKFTERHSNKACA